MPLMNEISYVSEGSIAPCRFVKAGSADESMLQCGAGEKPIGIITDGQFRTPGLVGSDSAIAVESGYTARVFVPGEDCLLELGTGGATYGAWLKSDTDGKGVATTSDGDEVGAQALQAGSAGDKVRVLVIRRQV